MSHDDAVAASGFHEYKLVRCHENRSERLNKQLLTWIFWIQFRKLLLFIQKLSPPPNMN